jgi:hypothetical protein
MGDEVAYTLELDEDEVPIVVEALRIFRENWEKGMWRTLVGDLQDLSPAQAADVAKRCSAILERLPARGLVVPPE